MQSLSRPLRAVPDELPDALRSDANHAGSQRDGDQSTLFAELVDGLHIATKVGGNLLTRHQVVQGPSAGQPFLEQLLPVGFLPLAQGIVFKVELLDVLVGDLELPGQVVALHADLRLASSTMSFPTLPRWHLTS